MKSRHIETIVQRLNLEIGFAGELGAAGLTEAIVEALEKGGVLEEAAIVYIRAEAPGMELMSVDIWAPELEQVVATAAPPMMPPWGDESPVEDDSYNRPPEPNV